MFGLEKYKDIFGKPNENLHTHFLNIAIFDLVLTILFAFIITLIINFTFWNFIIIFIIIFSIGQLFHFIFGVQTSFIKIF